MGIIEQMQEKLREFAKQDIEPKKILINFTTFETLAEENKFPVNPSLGVVTTILGLSYEVSSNITQEEGFRIV